MRTYAVVNRIGQPTRLGFNGFPGMQDFASPDLELNVEPIAPNFTLPEGAVAPPGPAPAPEAPAPGEPGQPLYVLPTEEQETPPAEEAPPEEPVEEGGGIGTLGWVLIGTAAAAAVGGLVALSLR